jgi:hypothetical protein
MISLFRGLFVFALIAGLAALCGAPAQIGAQDKKDTKDAKDKGKDDLKDRVVGVGTSDGLSLNGYFFQGTTIEKQRPDAVIMVPAPGSKINEAWISLAQELSKKNFSVLLMDWRGCGLNGPDGIGAGARVIDDKDKFWRERYNGELLMKSQKNAIESKGLAYDKFRGSSDTRIRYMDFALMNDLQAARFFLDKQNDAGKCNTNRTWIISEKDGAHVAMAFIAAEFQRNTKYDPKTNIFDTSLQFKSAGKDYAGIVALSYSPSNTSANLVYRNAMPVVGANEYVKDGRNHMTDRLAMVLLFNKKEGPSYSKSLAASVGVTGTDDEMRKKYKYLKEFDSKAAATVTGISMIDPMDSLGVKKAIEEALVGISKAQPFGKDPTERDAAKMLNIPRFPAETFTLKKN